MIYALIALNILAQLTDWHSTKIVLDKGGKELNPVVRWIISKVGMKGLAVVKVTAIAGFAAIAYPQEWPLILTLVAFGAISIRNYRIGSKMK